MLEIICLNMYILERQLKKVNALNSSNFCLIKHVCSYVKMCNDLTCVKTHLFPKVVSVSPK